MRCFPRLMAFLLAALLTACGGGDDAAPVFTMSGRVQKGPLIFGSTVIVSELDASLQPNGRTYVTQTIDDLGNFEVSTTIGSRLVAILAEGYYRDERTGGLSAGPVTLRAIADLAVEASPTVNVLTTLQAPRMRRLLSQGTAYPQAFAQSQAEVLAAFGIDASRVIGLRSLTAMRVDGNADPDAVLLAASAVLSVAATIRAGEIQAESNAAGMAYTLASMAEELRAGGTLSSDAATQALRRAMTEPDLATMRSSIESMYRSLGVSITAPAFEEWIDADASGHLPRRVRDMPGLALDDLADAQAGAVLTSNAVTVRTAPGEYVYVEADSGSTIVRNGEPIGFHRTQATDGDTLALQRAAPGFSASAQGTLVVGATRLAWHIRTRTPVVEFVSKVGATCPFLEVWGNSDPGHGAWHALPLQPDRALRLDMIALEGYTIESFKRVSIHANGADDRPGARLATTQTLQRHFDGVTIPVAGSDARFGDRALGAASYPSYNVGEWDFGVPGLALQAGVRYWIVLEGYDPGYLDGAASVMGEPPFGSYLVSADGATWKYPARTYRCPGQPDLVRTMIPRVYLID